MRKFLSFALVILIMFVTLNIFPEKTFSDISIRNVVVSPAVVDVSPQYTIYIVLGADLNRGENLYVKFPAEFTLPQSINRDFVEINTYKPSSVVVSSNTVILTLSEPILKNQGAGSGGIAVVFLSQAGIKTPTTPDIYSIEVWSQTEPNHSIYSFYIGVTSQGSSVKDLNVIVRNSWAGKMSEYDISFTVSENGALLPSDYVDVYFPKGTLLPSKPDASKVLVNYLNATSVSVENRRVRVYIPEGRVIAPGAKCSIIFLEDFGIINPEFTGNFAVQVSTSKDTGLATSNLYTLFGTSISLLAVSVSPSSQKTNAEYTIQFRTSKDSGRLEKELSKINIKFSSSFNLPSFVKPGAITVNNTPCTSVTLSDEKLTIISPINILDDSLVTIVIKKDFGIINPESTGNFEVFVNTSSDAVYVSSSFEITPSTISVPLVTLSNNSAGQLSSYTIVFETGVSGNLNPGIDRINVIFPIGTTIPSVLPNSAVLVNGVPTTLVEIAGTTITITAPVEIKANSQVTVVFEKGAGLRNPVQAGNYKLTVFTSKEQTPMLSSEYKIVNVPQTTMSINPSTPDGLNGFYKTKPTISFSATSALDPNPTIYYYFDKNNPTQFTQTEIVAPEGVHTLYYYSVDKYGHREEPQAFQVKVDTIPPQIVVLYPQNNAVLGSKTLLLKGMVDVGSTVKVDGENVIVDGSGNFEKEIQIQDSKANINIFAQDIAGNTAQTTVTVTLDTTPPPLTITSPVNFQTITKLPISVEGMTEAQAKVTVNGNAVIVGSDGHFKYDLQTLDGDLSVIKVEAEDEAGNKTTRQVTVKYVKSTKMILQVGNIFALVNDATYKLEAAPVITSNRTMVPLRFIGEAFGAQFTYESTTKTIYISFGSDKIVMQIGKKTATVNGRVLELDVAPFIVNGRTLVPIRFISETFGAEVSWEQSTKTVIIIYPRQ